MAVTLDRLLSSKKWGRITDDCSTQFTGKYFEVNETTEISDKPVNS